MSDPRPPSSSDAPAPSSSAPAVLSAAPGASSAAPSARLPLGLAGIGLCGVISFSVMRLTLPPEKAASERTAASAAERLPVVESEPASVEVEPPAPERSIESAPDCVAAGRSVQEAARYTKVPPDAAGHELEAWVEVMRTGIVADVQPRGGSDARAMSALRAQLATLRGLPGPCNELRVFVQY